MTDELNPEQTGPVVSTETGKTEQEKKKRKPPAKRKTVTAPSAAKADLTAATAKPRRYSDEERAHKLSEIEARAADGESLKSAIKSAGISEQTFYQWRRAAADQPKAETKAKAGDLETLSDLVELEAENIRLRSLLADKLRAENTELRKRLGLD